MQNYNQGYKIIISTYSYSYLVPRANNTYITSIRQAWIDFSSRIFIRIERRGHISPVNFESTKTRSAGIRDFPIGIHVGTRTPDVSAPECMHRIIFNIKLPSLQTVYITGQKEKKNDNFIQVVVTEVKVVLTVPRVCLIIMT